MPSSALASACCWRAIRTSTVKTHVGRILAKASARDRVQAVIFAYDTRLVRPT